MKKILTIILIGVMLVSIFAGCTNKETNQVPKGEDNTDTSDKTGSKDGSKSDDGETIQLPYTGEPIVFKGYGYDGLDTNPDTICAKAWKEHIGNITIEWEYAPFSDYAEKAKVYLASGEIPDVLPIGDIHGVINEYGSTGMFLDFNQYADYMPNLQKYREQYPSMDWINTKDNERFGIIGVQPIDFSGESWFANVDMLDKAGMKEIPNTLDELIDAMKAVKEADPESIPFQSYWNIPYAQGWFADALGAERALTYYDTNDREYKFSYREASAKRKELIELMAMLYKEGLINSEIQSLSFEQELNIITQGKWAFTAVYNRSIEEEAFKAMPGEEIPLNIEPMMPPKPENGSRVLPIAYQHDNIPHWGIVCSSKVKNPEYLAVYMDQVVSPFGRDIFNHGIEGETFDIIDGEYVLKEGIDREEAGIGTQYEVWMVGMGPLVRDAKGSILTQKAIDNNLENFLSGDVKALYDPVVSAFSSEEGEEKANLENTLNTFIDENEAKFIYGIRDMSEWDAYVEEIEKVINVDDLLDILNSAEIFEKDKERIFVVE